MPAMPINALGHGDYAPFDAQGGLGKMHQRFGDQMDAMIAEVNKELTA